MISIVVPVRDGAGTLERCLASLRESAPDAQIIVVDDHSGDSTAAIATRMASCIVTLEGSEGAAAARNAGAAVAEGSVLLFTDADVLMSPAAVERIRAHFGSPDAGPLCGMLAQESGAGNLASVYKNTYMNYSYSLLSNHSAAFYTSVAAVRREQFEAAGGFDGRYPGAGIEDLDLGLRFAAAGWPVRLDKDLRVTHLHRYDVAGILFTAYRRARGAVRISLRNSRTANGSQGQTSPLSFRLSIAAAAAAVVLLTVGTILGNAALLAAALAATASAAILNLGFGRAFVQQAGVLGAPFFLPLLFVDLAAHGLGILSGFAGYVLLGRKY